MRLSYSRTSEGDLSVEDTNDYYPFGLNFVNIHARTAHPVFNPSVGFQNWKYNGKELEETGMYDYGARFYMPDIGRFGMYDPLAERTMGPYAYVYNNPLKMIDPTGMEGESSDSGGGEAGGGGESSAGGMPSSMGTDRYGNETVNIGYGVNISAGTAAISVSNFGDNSEDSGGKGVAGINYPEKMEETKIDVPSSDSTYNPQKISSYVEGEGCCKNMTVTTKLEAMLIRYINLFGAKIELKTTAGTTKGQGNVGVTTTNGGAPTYSVKYKLNSMTSVSGSYDKYGNLTGISGQVSLGGATLSGSLSQGTFSAEASLKRGDSFNGIKGSVTPGAGPSSFPKLLAPPPIPLPMPALVP